MIFGLISVSSILSNHKQLFGFSFKNENQRNVLVSCGSRCIKPFIKVQNEIFSAETKPDLCYVHLHAGRQVIRWNWAMITAIDNQSDKKDSLSNANMELPFLHRAEYS